MTDLRTLMTTNGNVGLSALKLYRHPRRGVTCSDSGALGGDTNEDSELFGLPCQASAPQDEMGYGALRIGREWSVSRAAVQNFPRFRVHNVHGPS
jgi:hypothetical protein